VNEYDASELVTALYDRWYFSLVRYALRSTENYEIAEDLAQETLMQLYQALRAGKDIEHPKAWSLCVLRRAMNRQMNERSRFEQLEGVEIASETPSDMAGFFALADIRALLSVLSTREEEVLLLRLEAMKYREIADQLGISINSVNTLLARALRKLQDAMLRQMCRERVNEHAVKSAIRTS
jgi:RNA polymerase sigma-19 factor, ECF subfamily